MVVGKGSVWEIAITDVRKQKAAGTDSNTEKQPRQATLLFLGTRGAGKTVLIQKFLDREESTKPTLALEYTYARKSGKTLAKDVCHIWELGGGAIFKSLLSTPMTYRSIDTMAIFMVLDLSKPETIWIHLEILLNEIQERIENVILSPEGQKLQIKSKLEAAAWARLGEDHQDKELIQASLVPLIIIGGKYDLFQDLEPESKKLICRALRFIAHTNGASLLFFSSKDSGLIKKAKEMQSHFGFGSHESASLSQDYNKPLIIHAGSDSLNFISGVVEDTTQAMNYDAWKRAFAAKFPQEDKMTSIVPGDPSRNSFYAEQDVDNLRAQKDQELERLRREVGVEIRPKSTRRRQTITP